MNAMFSCPVCEATTTSVAKLQNHLERHLGQSPFTCKLCERKFVLKLEINQHIKMKHPKTNPECCRLEDPDYEENPKVALNCLFCKEVIQCREDLKHHSFVHNKEASERRHTEKEEVRTSGRLRNKRNRQYQKLKAYRWKCLMCSALLPDLTELNFHISEHLHVYLFTCSSCALQCYSRSDAVRHVVTSDHETAQIEIEVCKGDSPVLDFQCRCCGEAINSQELLDAHAQSHYTVSTPK